jgi:hypothetical protein
MDAVVFCIYVSAILTNFKNIITNICFLVSFRFHGLLCSNLYVAQLCNHLSGILTILLSNLEAIFLSRLRDFFFLLTSTNGLVRAVSDAEGLGCCYRDVCILCFLFILVRLFSCRVIIFLGHAATCY